MWIINRQLITSLTILLGIVVFKVKGQQYYGSPQLRSSMPLESSMPTVTVRGFLNFRTTVDGTIIVFTPSPSSQNSRNPEQPIARTTQPYQQIEPTRTAAINHNDIRATRVPNNNNLAATQTYPTGLVTVVGGTVVNGGSTTVYETKVIGTYISGKYAQILSSTTKVKPIDQVSSPTIRPTMAYSHAPVRPTRTPHYQRHRIDHHHQLNNNNEDNNNNNQDNYSSTRNEDEHNTNAIRTKKIHPLRAKSIKLVESSKARHLNARLQLNPLKSRWTKLRDNDENNNNNNNNNNGDNLDNSNENKSSIKVRRLKIIGAKRFTLPPRQTPRVKMNRFKSKLPATQAEEMQQYYSTKEKEMKDKEENESATIGTINEDGTETKQTIDEGTRQKILENLSQMPALNIEPDSSDSGLPSDGNEDSNGDGSVEPGKDFRTEIDPSKVVKEVQTITSEVTQHVEGNHLQIKTLTLTTTIERTLHPTESEFNAQVIQPTLDVSVNNIEATSIPETPSLVISRTYSVTERTMRTTVVPVFDGTATQSHTVTESFFIRKLITAYRTLPPGDMILIDSTSTSAFNPELNTALVLNSNGTDIDDLSMAEQQTIQPSSVDSNIQPTEMPKMLDDELNNVQTLPTTMANQIESSISPFGMPQLFPSQLSIQGNQLAQQFDLNNPLMLAAVLQNPQLAALYLGLQQMNKQQQQQATQYQTITKPAKIMQTETLYNTKMVSYYDGRQTRSRTILEPTGTTERLVNTYTTEVVPVMNNQYAMQQAQLQNMFATQLGVLPQFQMTPTAKLQSSTILKTVTTVTDSTMTKSKVYTLVYNAFSTRYRTVTSTSITPTTVTTVLTETIQISPSSTMLPAMNFFG